MIAEVTWDFLMEEDMGWIEGCYRLPDQPWQVVIAGNDDEVSKVEVRNGLTWASGVTGMNIFFPKNVRLNATLLLKVMSDVLGVCNWVEVRGPDSIVIR